MELSYAELEDFLADLHRVASSKRTALKGRLKHFQRLGWPSGTNKGKGARVSYGIGQTMMLAMGMELLQLGLTPERVVSHLRFSSGFLADGFAEALKQYGPTSDDVFYVFAPESLHSLREDGENDFGFASMLLSKSTLGQQFDFAPLTFARRFAFINISGIFRDYVEYFSGERLESPESLGPAIANWQKVAAESYAKYNQRYMERMRDGDT